jgi:hypothetical protein
MLLPPQRQVNPFCRPPSSVQNLQCFGPLERLYLLWRQPDVRGLRFYFNDDNGRYYGYNYANLADYDDDGDEHAASQQQLQTVEFRMFRGCLDADTIIAWARVVCRLVEFAHAFSHHLGPLPMLEHALRFVTPEQPATGHDILRAIGLEDLLPFFPLHPATMPEDQDVVPHTMRAIISRRRTGT